jgi:hypothetical protein
MKEDGSFTLQRYQNLKSEFKIGFLTLRHQTVSSLHVEARALVVAAALHDAVLKEGFHAVVRPILIKQIPL